MTKEPTGKSFPFDLISYMSATVWEYISHDHVAGWLGFDTTILSEGRLIQNPTLKEKCHLWECPIKITVVNS